MTKETTTTSDGLGQKTGAVVALGSEIRTCGDRDGTRRNITVVGDEEAAQIDLTISLSNPTTAAADGLRNKGWGVIADGADPASGGEGDRDGNSNIDESDCHDDD